MFFWVFPRRQFVVGRRFGTLYRFNLQRLVVDCLLPAFEDGTDTGFRNVGQLQIDAGEIPKRTFTISVIILFNILLTVHLNIFISYYQTTWCIKFYNKFISSLYMLKMFFWVFPRRQIVVGRRFGTLYRFHLQRLMVDCLPPAFEDGTDTGFRNVGQLQIDAGEITKRTFSI